VNGDAFITAQVRTKLAWGQNNALVILGASAAIQPGSSTPPPLHPIPSCYSYSP
jgi:hypothetical protein